MIPRLKSSFYNAQPEGRYCGTGGGGNPQCGAVTPYFCKRCGKTVARTAVLENCDVCKKCRVTK